MYVRYLDIFFVIIIQKVRALVNKDVANNSNANLDLDHYDNNCLICEERVNMCTTESLPFLFWEILLLCKLCALIFELAPRHKYVYVFVMVL